MKRLALPIVTKHINQWDPEYLLELGAPDDEYEYEIKQIVKAVLESKDEIEVAEAIQDTFRRAFDREYDYEECHTIAAKIWKELYE
ncbi:hypothetical protein GCM10010978_16860 [Compostibacillus humi]|uniref:DUF1871 family protein n=1 Tax=Compostibacillus humi TaxID=1245525 RepID=A0A8J2TL82_9BACI|nr:DUF1871 family protein [Compostibacillus humi]GFZ75898.1 hypothetical protein GCM10010978_16860 [Compostibacillus humi]